MRLMIGAGVHSGPWADPKTRRTGRAPLQTCSFRRSKTRRSALTMTYAVVRVMQR
jgi:hypothetical protein